MFGAYTFASPTFAGVLAIKVTPAPVSGPKKGWPFGDDLRVPDARRVPRFPRAERAVEIEREDADLAAIANLFLNLK